MTRPDRPDAATLRVLAVRHHVDPRSIVAALAGRPVRGMAGARAAAAADDYRRGVVAVAGVPEYSGPVGGLRL